MNAITTLNKYEQMKKKTDLTKFKVSAFALLIITTCMLTLNYRSAKREGSGRLASRGKGARYH